MKWLAVPIGLIAVVLEGGALALLLQHTHGNTWLLLYLLIHALGCIAIALAVWLPLPARYHQANIITLLLLFCLNFFIPLFGILGFLVGVAIAFYSSRLSARQPFTSVWLPHYERAKTASVNERLRSSQLRSQLVNQDIPTEMKMKALIAINNISPLHASSILRNSLNDPADDLRLLAYGILEKKESRITSRINHAIKKRQNASNAATTYQANKVLAELYWELDYQGLVQNDMRRHTLEQAQHYVLAALAYPNHDASLWATSGRIKIKQGHYDEALSDFNNAVKGGFATNRIALYLAELAFFRRDYGEVRSQVQLFGNQSLGQSMMNTVNFWKST